MLTREEAPEGEHVPPSHRPVEVLGQEVLVHFENACAIVSDASSNAILRLAAAFRL